jgi:hypothetical protein
MKQLLSLEISCQQNDFLERIFTSLSNTNGDDKLEEEVFLAFLINNMIDALIRQKDSM